MYVLNSVQNFYHVDVAIFDKLSENPDLVLFKEGKSGDHLLGFVLWELQVPVPKFMAIHPVAVEVFLPAPGRC